MIQPPLPGRGGGNAVVPDESAAPNPGISAPNCNAGTAAAGLSASESESDKGSGWRLAHSVRAVKRCWTGGSDGVALIAAVGVVSGDDDGGRGERRGGAGMRDRDRVDSGSWSS